MKTVTPTELRTNIYHLLDEVLETGIPLEIKKGDKRLRIIAVEQVDKFQNLVARPQVILGDPAELVSINWENEVNVAFAKWEAEADPPFKSTSRTRSD